MEMLKCYPNEMSKKDKYRMMKSRAVQKMTEMNEREIVPRAWLLYNDTDLTSGEIKKVLVIMDDSTGEMYGTISPSFIGDFEDIITIFGDDIEGGGIMPLVQKSKNGREYLVCEVG